MARGHDRSKSVFEVDINGRITSFEKTIRDSSEVLTRGERQKLTQVCPLGDPKPKEKRRHPAHRSSLRLLRSSTRDVKLVTLSAMVSNAKVRDDFSKATREKLAQSAGYKCSKPDCCVPTRGATSDGRDTIDIGVAAHITAAAPGGPRYDPSLTAEQRKSFNNGIWLCQSHAKLIDSDKSQFTVERLRDWKRCAERRSFFEVVSAHRVTTGALVSEHDVQTTLDSLRGLARADIAAFQNAPGWPAYSIALDLTMSGGEDSTSFSVSGLAAGVSSFDQVAVIAPPGTGKTITLLQLTEAVLGDNSLVAVYLPLAEWATGSDDFLVSVLKRKAFRRGDIDQFELLAHHGKLLLVLDGWNELDESSKRRVRSQVKFLRRDFPDLHLVISSRHMAFDIPIDGPVVEVQPLTEEQQLEIARSRRGSDGESLLDHAWRTPGLRQLVAIPLYLNALLVRAPGASLPTTKEEVLRSFVEELERDRDKLATLRETLQGVHRRFMEEIAVEAMRLETVALSEVQARTVVNAAQQRLRDENQIADLLQPMKVLDGLVSAHMLVRYGVEEGGVAFQHQQFQEWFASFHVERLMLSSARGDEEASKYLRETILDIPVWEEAILFTCDRVSRSDRDGVQAVAQAVLETLGIDPLLAAQMIRRSSDDVWAAIRRDVTEFVAKWHTPGRVDRAVAFMIDTGCVEFSGFVWPLISAPDDQVHLAALRAGRRFRPGVLGANAGARIAELSKDVRKNIISEIAMNGDMDGIEFATRLASDDASQEVKLSVIESLLFRRADRFAKVILESATDEVWRQLAGKWYPREIDDEEIAARIQQEVDRLHAEETDPSRMLSTLISAHPHDADSEEKVRELVQRIDFSDKDQNSRWLVHHAHEKYPGAVELALLSLLEQGRDVPFGADDILRSSDLVVDDGPLAGSLLDKTIPRLAAESAASVIGPATTGELIDQIFEVRARVSANQGKYDKTLSEEYLRLVGLVSGTKTKPFVQAVLDRSGTDSLEEIAILADLVSRHGDSVERHRLALDSSMQDRLTAAVGAWGERLLISPTATRAQFAEIAEAAERLESPEHVGILLKLLSEDLARRRQAIDEFISARQQGRNVQNDARMSWTLQYRRAFAAIGDEQTIEAMKAYLPDHEFGVDAAHVLVSVWRRTQPEERTPGMMRSWPDYSVVPERFEKRQNGAASETHPFVDDIVAVIDDLVRPGAEDAALKHALKLAILAFSMPYADKEATITNLLESPVPEAEKRDLLITLVLAGEAISSDVVLPGIEELLEEAESTPWLLRDQDGWRLKEWLKLLAFTDKPSTILSVLQRVEGFGTEPWNMREIVSVLGYVPSVRAETVLTELARLDNRFLSNYDWLSALVSRDTLSAARSLLDLICSESLTDKRGRADRRDWAGNLATLMSAHDQFRNEVYSKFLDLEEGPAKSTLEFAIAEAADVAGMLLLTRSNAASGTRFRETHLYRALQNMLVGKTPIGPSGMQELYGLPAQDLRKALFDLVVNGDVSESQLATDCLNAIDEIRDDYGHVDVEPRHPDITVGVPWPNLEAGNRTE